MNPTIKLRMLGENARFDVCGYPAYLEKKRSTRYFFIYPAAGEGTKITRLFKILQTNICENNCLYCMNRRDRNFTEVVFEPDELAYLFMKQFNKGITDGLFLSSAIKDSPTKSQEEMLKTIKILREKYNYTGYIHCKILPGVETNLIREVHKLSDRISLNLEASNEEHLCRISKDKDFKELYRGLKILSSIEKKSPKQGITTQLIVGASEDEKDRDIILESAKLYKELGLARVYYSGFVPVKETPLESSAPCPPGREMRLYQADFLIRKYNFTPEELPYDSDGNLPQDKDPKLAWAQKYEERFPIEVNEADFEQLLRVPGIGKISAQRIVEARPHNKIKTFEDLRRLGAVVKKARNFTTIDGKYLPQEKGLELERKEEKQLFLWEEL